MQKGRSSYSRFMPRKILSVTWPQAESGDTPVKKKKEGGYSTCCTRPQNRSGDQYIPPIPPPAGAAVTAAEDTGILALYRAVRKKSTDTHGCNAGTASIRLRAGAFPVKPAPKKRGTCSCLPPFSQHLIAFIIAFIALFGKAEAPCAPRFCSGAKPQFNEYRRC